MGHCSRPGFALSDSKLRVLDSSGGSRTLMPGRGEMLVAILNNLQDFRIAKEKHWYRIPVSSAHKWLRDCWPPLWLAFYQTKVFGQEAHSVRYYARIIEIREVFRWHLFPKIRCGTRKARSASRSDNPYYLRFLLLSLPRFLLAILCVDPLSSGGVKWWEASPPAFHSAIVSCINLGPRGMTVGRTFCSK